MTVLGGKEIERRIKEIFEEGTYSQSSIDSAAYNLRLDDEELVISGQTYHRDNKYPYAASQGRIILPARKISIISTIEKFTMPQDLVGRCGLTFTWTKEGLVPLFGPQIDPGYRGKFYAVVYNISSKEIALAKGEPILKMELHEVENVIVSTPRQYSIFDLPAGITAEEFISDLGKKIDALEKENKDIKQTLIQEKAKLEEALTGYRYLTTFGLFLIAASILGIVLTSLLSGSDKLVALIGNADLAVFLLTVVVVMLGVVFAISIISVARSTSGR